MRRFCALPLAALLASSCAPDLQPVAILGERVITAGEFRAAAAAYARNYPLPPDSARRRLLSDLVARELIARLALDLGYDRDPDYALAVRGAEMPLLTDALYRDQVGGAVPVSDAEVREFYRQRGFETRARIVVTRERAGALRALQELQRGGDFAAVSDRYSMPGLVPAGGDLGFVTPGGLFDPVDEEVRRRPTGWTSGVIELPRQGYVIVRVEERRPREQPSLLQEEPALRELLSQRKQRTSGTRILDQLQRAYALQPAPGGSQFLFQKFTSLRAPSFFGRDARPEMPEFTPAELESAVVLWRGGRYTVRQALADLQNAPQRPSLAMLPQIQEFLQGYALQHVAVAEARRRGLHRAGTVAPRYDQLTHEWLVRRVYDRLVVPRASVSPEALQAVYERRKPELVRVEEARVRYALLADQAQARMLAEPPAHGEEGHAHDADHFDLAARAAARGVPLREETLDVLAHPPLWQPYEDLFTQMADGEVAGPFQTEHGWLVFQLVSRKASVPAFEELDPFAQRDLMSEALDQARAAAFGRLADSLKAATRPYRLFPDRLMRVPWPAASPDAREGAAS